MYRFVTLIALVLYYTSSIGQLVENRIDFSMYFGKTSKEIKKMVEIDPVISGIVNNTILISNSNGVLSIEFDSQGHANAFIFTYTSTHLVPDAYSYGVSHFNLYATTKGLDGKSFTGYMKDTPIAGILIRNVAIYSSIQFKVTSDQDLYKQWIEKYCSDRS